LTLLVGLQEEHPAVKTNWWDRRMLALFVSG